MSFRETLPIDDVLPQIRTAAASSSNLVIVAPPGAGKTTRVPLALLDAQWAAGGKLVLLEPRRLAARAAATRMAATLGEAVGETIGLRMRLESKISSRTRVEVVTEGVFARMILDDPMLEGVAAVIFDEFHERSLDADVGLALALDAQAGLREDLRILAMSATLDGARVASVMRGATIVESEGRTFAVETRYLGRAAEERVEEAVARAVRRGLAEEHGSLLAFLPGQAEIQRVASLLAERGLPPDVDVAPLYGAMERKDQDLAVAPAAAGRRKVTLATSIAETSLTIEGVRVVVDCGLSRVAAFEPDLGLTRLETVRASRASVDQRRGRAGRTEPGVCYRLWDEAATASLPAFAAPEILAADLSGLALDLRAWGVDDPRKLPFLDAPPRPAYAEAVELLRSLGALDEGGALTPLGQAMRALPIAPRLARMALEAARHGEAERAADLALLLSERGLGGNSADLSERLERFRSDGSRRARDARRLSGVWAKQARAAIACDAPADLSDGALIAMAFPDRIAKARGSTGEFLMASGRAASVPPHEPLAAAPFLAVAEVTGRAAQARVLAACALSAEEVERIGAGRIETRDETMFDPASGALRRRRFRRLGAIRLTEQNLPAEPNDESAAILARGAATVGVGRLPWSKAQMQLRDRLAFLRRAEGDAWPDVSDEGLAQRGEDWLAPFIIGRASLAAITAEDLDAALAVLTPFELTRRLEREAPPFFETPAGSRHALDYAAANGPLLSVRVQELFGLAVHPTLAGGRAPLTLELLSPAYRPIQTTRDLPGFWAGSWAEVKREMKGRYPRHPWPDDPAKAAPTTRAKPRGT
ncbi:MULTISPECIES: ATP-dependent helicase HrpB [Methylosinus]|uniref:ATP-dependent helicase HrpB n=1 Tax=Methylosinus trichosporium (strain ATCC 35070 / NCIMB 11131 / UNIQEM 75 / OB3b) TaxID=595536 RepID=A0A2D2CW70_METT3|nr:MULTISPECIES: ATP-dependent helicase HrpB [Methylosinus]ATQ66997.1 ATP-dependent helicase HrpB [Methylosinus trichosporium OB3b]OBS54527.1 ATP-dependent helicase HrpB [Methylosinus sp. 3S-1]